MNTDHKVGITIALVVTLIAGFRVDPYGVSAVVILLLAIVYVLGKQIDWR